MLFAFLKIIYNEKKKTALIKECSIKTLKELLPILIRCRALILKGCYYFYAFKVKTFIFLKITKTC